MASAWRPFGKHKVGFLDVEWLSPKEGAVSSDGSVDPTLHLSGRIYYPADAAAQHSRLALRSGVSWLPDYNYARGLAKFIFFRPSLVRPTSRARTLMLAALQQSLQQFTALVGTAQLVDYFPGAALVGGEEGPHPVVVFSHGLAGNRGIYSILCAELASQGYIVLAVEHADGSASACKLAGGKGWKFYGGLGGEEGQVAKTRHRVAEMKTALRVLRALNKGEALEGGPVQLSHGADATRFFAGALDLKCLAAMGHSYGGATITALVAEDPVWRCGIALDPWWYAMPPEAAALKSWRTRVPLCIMGSHDWNVPTSSGQLLCGGERQEAILQAARSRRQGEDVGGAGAMLLVVNGSSHNTYADPLALFSQHLGWLLEKLGLASRLDPELGIHLTSTAALNFLATHLPLSPAQRAMQSWEPTKSHSALDRIRQRTAADNPTTGFFATVFPRGRGLLYTVSDWMLNRALRLSGGGSGTGRPLVDFNAAPPGSGKAVPPADGANGEAAQPAGAQEEPDDVATAAEALEAALPSAHAASGPHPFAPSQEPPPEGEGEGAEGASGSAVAAAKEAAAAGEGATAAAAREAAVLAAIGTQHYDSVREEEAEQLLALLGAEHIFKCEVHA